MGQHPYVLREKHPFLQFERGVPALGKQMLIVHNAYPMVAVLKGVTQGTYILEDATTYTTYKLNVEVYRSAHVFCPKYFTTFKVIPSPLHRKIGKIRQTALVKWFQNRGLDGFEVAVYF